MYIVVQALRPVSRRLVAAEPCSLGGFTQSFGETLFFSPLSQGSHSGYCHPTISDLCMSIIISRSGRNAERLERTVIQQENYLQEYIHANPASLPLHEIKEDLRLLILAREFPTDSGPIDALGVDADGDLYVIETKLYKNQDKRKVIAQMLDYGASLWSADADQFISRLEVVTTAGFDVGLGPKLRDFFGIDEEEILAYLDTLKQNVAGGRFRFVVLMDRLDDRLKDLISFVNTNSRFDVLSVELDFYQHHDIEIIIPSLYGAERKKQDTSSGSSATRRKWDESSFFADAEERLDRAAMAALRDLYAWSKQHADSIAWGTGTAAGAFIPKFDHIHDRSVYRVRSNGWMTLSFKWLGDTEAGRAYAHRLGEELQHAGVLKLPSDYADRYPKIRVEQWVPKVEAFIGVLERTVLRQ